MEKHRADQIEPNIFDKLLKEYPSTVPEKLEKLDQERYETIPDSLKKQSNLPRLTKDQVATLVDWKLSHGKFRPTLKSLLQQNDDLVVSDITRDGFQIFDGSMDSVKESIKLLTLLKGIGPATASLILSVHNPDDAPFFSDELFRWCFFEDGKGKGWDRGIKYNVKEYLELYSKVQEIRRRFKEKYQVDVAAVELEKVAYVLGKRGVGASNVVKEVAGGHSKKRKASMNLEANEDPTPARSGSTTGTAKEVPGKRGKRSQLTQTNATSDKGGPKTRSTRKAK